MPVIVSGGETHTIELDPDGSVTSQLNLTIGLPSIMHDLASNGLTLDRIDSSLGGGFSTGAGPVGMKFFIFHSPGTDKYSFNINITHSFLGGEVDVVGTHDPHTGSFIVDQAEAFGGVSVILGAQKEFLGVTVGEVGTVQAGIFFNLSDEGLTSFPGARITYSQGLILGNAEGVSTWDATPILRDASDLTVETATRLFDALYQSSLDSMDDASQTIVRLMLPIVNVLDPIERRDALNSFLERAGIEECFLAGTMIDMWDGTEKPIEDVRPDDWVTSYDRDGHLVPGRVSRVFRHQARHILDVFGLKVTPGHVTLCGDGPFDGQHVPIIDILRSDGALVRKDGTKVRASTGIPLGDMRDRLIWAVTGDTVPGGGTRVRDKGRIRLGTRFITDDGRDICVADLIFGRGATVTEDGLIQTGTGGDKMPYHWPFTVMLPNPEDYVLRRSAVSLTEIYRAARWESVPPRLPPPAGDTPGPMPLGPMPPGPMPPGAAPPQAAAPSGEPPPMRPQRHQPALNRKQRRAIAARQRRTPKPLPGTTTVQ